VKVNETAKRRSEYSQRLAQRRPNLLAFLYADNFAEKLVPIVTLVLVSLNFRLSSRKVV
ncbi:unnamed protein product, partial [Acidithrix sp. C25]